MKLETRRALIEKIEGRTVSGYAARFNVLSKPIPGWEGSFREQILPGAFDSRGDVSLFWMHDFSQPVANTKSGTLVVTVDEIGLRYEATLGETAPDTHRLDLIKRKVVNEMSFGFRVPKGGDSWNTDRSVRTLKRIELREISLVEVGAYPGTSAEARNHPGNEGEPMTLIEIRAAIAAAMLVAQNAAATEEQRADALIQVAELHEQRAAAMERDLAALATAPNPSPRPKPKQKQSHESRAREEAERFDEARADPEYRNDWENWVRGRGPEPELRTDTLTTTGSGILIPKLYEDSILKYVDASSILRGKADFKGGIRGNPTWRVNTRVGSDYSNNWTTEALPAATSVNPTFVEVNAPPMTGIASTTVSTAAMVTSDFDIEGEVIDDLMRDAAACLEWSYSVGTGSGMPTGMFLTNTDTAQLQVTAAHGSGTGWDGHFTFVNLNKLRYKQLAPQYWNGAEWYMSQDAFYQISTLLDQNSRPLFNQDSNSGITKSVAGVTLMGAPVNVCAFAPARQTAASVSVPVVFGNLKEAFRIREWAGFGMLRDPLTTLGRVKFTLQPFANSKYVRPKAVTQFRVTLT